ncbi:MAG: type IV pili twitching motility protein PilT, partial [Gemmatimonadetes bacterium]|nr:type IV pili twitching motility protein PilT [Candidatus Kutchimonas denitrificans]NIS00551.1 type IV pili twitching motility protein PilT [Gemmatimonadota bacterium]NIU52449.1 type IV pili twitching motility protein PilT [Gemmatimonadota bacterium]NIW36411.1 type IV pili twitching motility protein PilT [Gemmatimonadota bacterium]NIY43909.1 type IV pili twitching motility protein PilT [Gemmatimonadota bacterium]
IGEMRDLETIAAALTIAETGHLALATLHTNSAAETINRIIDVFPSHQQSQVRAQLAFVLEGVITQTLLPRKNRSGRIAA